MVKGSLVYNGDTKAIPPGGCKKFLSTFNVSRAATTKTVVVSV